MPVPLFPMKAADEQVRPSVSAAKRRGVPSPTTPFPGTESKGHSSITRVVRLHDVAPQRSAGPTPPTPVPITAAVAKAKVVVELHVAGSESLTPIAAVPDAGNVTADSKVDGDDVPFAAGRVSPGGGPLVAISTVGSPPLEYTALLTE